ncbi:hypothetical protein SYNPS1DRAFT_27032 [Syncephalis pseudoplumigaleata]|uniref:Uncharacterized protein n=1 Tax=Syncephalis pseudoplumigaleata TaxID=1712513 RepID=A0A4P9Z420_9FUNG|nr:hypothetical protein SYNPS1DRAFT_27032 [Syncephalis pseudoplumigaleata]|eukprot:RKP27304.1 hypothetical protein SYNPS1DRAFT_27032 [Syncephalis pseudoplumigaleata]
MASDQSFAADATRQDVPSESQEALASSHAMAFLSELSNIDWVGHGWDMQEDLQHLLQNCPGVDGSRAVEDVPSLVNGDAFFSPLFEGDLAQLQSSLPALPQHAVSSACSSSSLTAHVSPSLALQPYPPSPSSSGAETDSASRAASTASPSPHLIAASKRTALSSQA